jgi:hypothetical protein
MVTGDGGHYADKRFSGVWQTMWNSGESGVSVTEMSQKGRGGALSPARREVKVIDYQWFRSESGAAGRWQAANCDKYVTKPSLS